ncbi:hypothetical protein [Nocardia sp. IFM 10818]
MARNPDNAKLYVDAHIYVSAELARPALPATINDPFAAAWEEVGILNGDDGITDERSLAENKFYGWNLGLIKVSAKDFELLRKFSLLEDNPTTQGIVNPGSTATKVAQAKPVYRWIAFETDSDLGVKERLFSIRRARLWVPADARKESDITKWEVSANLFADSSGNVFDRQAAA